MADDIFIALGERGPPLKDAIKEFLQRCVDDDYSPLAIVTGFIQFSANAAAQALPPPDLEAFACTLEDLARELRQIAPRHKQTGAFGGTQMNWRRGLFRLWLAIATAWIAWIAVVAYENIKAAIISACAAAVVARGGNPYAPSHECFDYVSFGYLIPAVFDDLIPSGVTYLGWALVALVPPLGIFALGLIVSWIVSGFRRSVT